MAEQKTNVMRALDQKKVRYTPHEYPHGAGAVDGVTVAGLIGVSRDLVFKTLVTSGDRKSIYEIYKTVHAQLDLKKAARTVGEKSIAMIHVSEITALTGYVRGGCSPIGMKKQYQTVYHESALEQQTIIVCDGIICSEVEVGRNDLATLTRGKFADIITED